MKKLQIIQKYYENNMSKGLAEYGILGWESEEAQKLRFDMLLNGIELEGKSLLDVGCGTGNLLEYINSKGLKVEYAGVDILDPMIKIANAKGLNGEFYHADIFKDNIFEKKTFDIIYSSGIFNLNLGNNRIFLHDAVGLFLKLSKEAVVFNLLHIDSPDREDKYFYFHPDELKKILADYSDKLREIEIVEAYLKNDFTVICRKEA